MTNKKYIVSKKDCQEKIDKNNNVCDYCGIDLVPIETVDNCGRPTFWAGCMHGNESGHFTSGVKKEIYDLAYKLVLDGEIYYSHMSRGEYNKNRKQREYWFQSQVSGFARMLQRVEYLKTHKPRETKKDFFANLRKFKS